MISTVTGVFVSPHAMRIEWSENIMNATNEVPIIIWRYSIPAVLAVDSSFIMSTSGFISGKRTIEHAAPRRNVSSSALMQLLFAVSIRPSPIFLETPATIPTVTSAVRPFTAQTINTEALTPARKSLPRRPSQNISTMLKPPFKMLRRIMGIESERIACDGLSLSKSTAFFVINSPKLRDKQKNGGANRIRTGDLVHAKHALSQLSYCPTRRGI